MLSISRIVWDVSSQSLLLPVLRLYFTADGSKSSHRCQSSNERTLLSRVTVKSFAKIF